MEPFKLDNRIGAPSITRQVEAQGYKYDYHMLWAAKFDSVQDALHTLENVHLIKPGSGLSKTLWATLEDKVRVHTYPQ